MVMTRSTSTEMMAPIFCSAMIRSMISGSMAAFDSSVLPCASTAARIICSVAPTLGYSRCSLLPVRRSQVRCALPVSSCSVAPRSCNPRMWKSTGRVPMRQPPRLGTGEAPKRASIGPQARIGMRLLPEKVFRTWRSMGRRLAVLISSTPGSGALTSPPRARMSSETMATSAMPATLRRVHFSPVSSAATMILGSEFLAPRSATSPASGCPPRRIMPSFPIQQAEETLDYDFTEIGDSEFFLPLVANLKMHSRGGMWTKNVKEFRLYRKFSADAVIKFDGQELPPLPDDKTKEQAPQPQPPK